MAKTIVWKVPMSVFEMKTFESGTKLISNLEPAKQAVEKHRSDILAVGERNADLERFSRAEISGVEHRLRMMKTHGRWSRTSRGFRAILPRWDYKCRGASQDSEGDQRSNEKIANCWMCEKV